MSRNPRTKPDPWLTQPRGLQDCFCCKTEFVFTIDSGGLCDDCNDGECPKGRCGQDAEDWL